MDGTRRSGLGLWAIGLGTITVPLDSAVNIAFPSITAAFGLAVEDIRWIVICYVLTYSSLMLVFGKLGDVVGHARIFVAGLVAASFGFVACALAPTYPLLLAARVLQGVGAALILSCGPALATGLYDESRRTRVLGIYAAIMATGSAAGPLVFGVLVEDLGWPIVFAARLPLCLASLALVAALRTLAAGARGTGGARGQTHGSDPIGNRGQTLGSDPAAPAPGAMRGFDVVGALLLIAWSVGLLLAMAAHSTPYGLALQAGLAGVGAAAFAAFVARQRRHASPIVRPALFADARFLAMNLASIAVNFAAFSILLLVPFWLARAAALPSRTAGLVLCLSAVGTIVGAWLAGRIAPRFGAGRLALAGMLASAGGLWAVSHWTAATTVPEMAAALLAHGVGLGLFQVAYTDLVVATLPKAERGVAGSLAMVTRTIGVVGAATGLAAAHRHFEASALAAGVAPTQAFVTGFTTTLGLVAAGLALAVVLWLLVEALRASRRSDA